jgi:protein gp37
MSAISKIEWTDRTWNPTRGCSIVSPGCVNCYAMKQAHRFSGPGKAYDGLTKQTKAGPQWTGIVRLVESALNEPLTWRKPARVFVNSMSDLFHESLPNEAIAQVFHVMYGEASGTNDAPHTYQILTKRPERMRDWFRWLRDYDGDDAMITALSVYLRTSGPHKRVWLGVSCEDQKRADERIPLLLETQAAVRFISAEPLLGPIDLRPAWNRGLPWLRPDGINWVIVGGESGPGARPCRVDWIESIVRQCRDAGVACFVKQLGRMPTSVSWFRPDWPDHVTYRNDPVHSFILNLADSKGGDPSDWPSKLRVREFPMSVSLSGRD